MSLHPRTLHAVVAVPMKVRCLSVRGRSGASAVKGTRWQKISSSAGAWPKEELQEGQELRRVVAGDVQPDLLELAELLRARAQKLGERALETLGGLLGVCQVEQLDVACVLEEELPSAVAGLFRRRDRAKDIQGQTLRSIERRLGAIQLGKGSHVRSRSRCPQSDLASVVAYLRNDNPFDGVCRSVVCLRGGR